MTVGIADIGHAEPGGSPRTPIAPENQPAFPTPVPIVDVWSRTAPKYRIRAIVFLTMSFLLFVGLCAFTHWLHVARIMDFSWQSYAAPARFWGEQTQNLNDFLRYPINVEEIPLQGVVLGLLVAAIVAVPILVAILYRLPCALPFVAAVFIFAHLPWLSFTLVIGCVLAAVRPFRMKFRYGSALLGMIPVLIYLYLATMPSPDDVGSAAPPAQKSLLIAPWVLAILSACLLMAVVLLIARWVNYRPGAIAPVMSLMFAMPAVLFFRFVGRDELYYRVMESEFGPRSERFMPVSMRPVADMIRQYTEAADFERAEEWRDIWRGRVDATHDRMLSRLARDFLRERAAAFDAFSRFIREHPRSRYVRCALYMQARVLDTRIDERAFRSRMHRELYSDFPHVQSEPAWTALLTQFPDSPLSISAGLRLAQLHLRRGEVDAAVALLQRINDGSLGRGSGVPSSKPAFQSLMSAPDPEASLNFDPRPRRFQASRLSELIAANRDDPRYGSRPLMLWAGLDPRRPEFVDETLRLAREMPDALLYDNLIVAWALAQPEVERRRAALEACVGTFIDSDALPEAMYQLADIEIQSAMERTDAPHRAVGIERMRDVVARFGDSCWAQAASERLRDLESLMAAR